MIRIVPTEGLKIGLYVLLELAWYEHPFIKNHFLISTEDELKKIGTLGLKKVKVDFSKSQISQEEVFASLAVPKEDACEQPECEPRIPIFSEEMLEVIHDRNLPPDQKASLVRHHSSTMMQKLLENPSADNIKDVKRGSAEIVDLILRDNETTFYLINITDHDFNTYTHSVNVGFLAVALAKALFRQSDDHDLHALGAGFFLHDLGKVQIGLDIINKRGKLTAEEMKTMKRHPAIGYFLLHEAKQMTKELKLIVLQHHEKMNGTGYPSGLRGDDIHIYGQICAIADIFDALTSQRPYKEKIPAFAALKMMKAEMVPHHISKQLLDRFIPLFIAP